MYLLSVAMTILYAQWRKLTCLRHVCEALECLLGCGVEADMAKGQGDGTAQLHPVLLVEVWRAIYSCREYGSDGRLGGVGRTRRLRALSLCWTRVVVARG